MHRLHRAARHKLVALAAAGVLLASPLGACRLEDLSIPVTLSGRDAATTLIRGAILGPLQSWLDRAINYAFDKLEGDDNP